MNLCVKTEKKSTHSLTQMSLSASKSRDKHRLLSKSDLDSFDDEDPKAVAEYEAKKRKILQNSIHNINEMSGKFLSTQDDTKLQQTSALIEKPSTPQQQSEFAQASDEEDDFFDWEDADGETTTTNESKKNDSIIDKDGGISM